jgi:photosystem II stability/assembly factor-like uncharacterized protein
MFHRLAAFLMLTVLYVQPASAAHSLAFLIGEDGRCVGLAGQPSEAATLALEACSDLAPDHYWFLPPRGFTGFIRSHGLCLDGSGGSVHLGDCTAGAFRLWRHETDGRLVAANQDLCLDSAQGFALAPCSGAPSQSFLAEGQSTWAPSKSGDPSDLLPIATPDPKVWYARNGFGLLRSANGGRSFSYLRDIKSNHAFAVSPFASSVLWNSTSGPLLERSRDGGLSWTPVADLGPIASGRAFAVVPSLRDPQRVFVYGMTKLMASQDGGESFEQRGRLPDHRNGESQLFDAGSSSLLYMNVDYCLFECDPLNVGLWRSSDDGATWQPVLRRESAVGAVKLVADPRAPETYYLTSRLNGESFGVLERSVDGGRTFQVVGPLPSSDGKLFRFAGEIGTFYLFDKDRLWRSPDLGASWEELDLPLGFAPWESELSVSAQGRLRLAAVRRDAAGLSAVYFDSEDGGESFTRIDPVGNGKINTTPLPVAFTSQPNRLYFLDGQTVMRTDDRGFSWSAGAQLIDAEAIVADPRNPDRVLAVSRSALWRSEDAGTTFHPVIEQVGALAAFDDGVRPVMLAASRPFFYRSVDGGLTWDAAPSADAERRFQKLAITATAIFAVSEHDQLYRSLDGGATYERVNVAEKSLVAGSGMVAYLRFDGSSLRISEDGGLTFEDHFPPEVFGGSSGLSIDKQGNLYIAGLSTVVRSSDRGRTWISLGRDLIGMTGITSHVVADPFDPGRLYHTGSLGLHFGRWHQRTPLELLGGRFEARVIWRDYLGQIGDGIARSLTGDTGLFWLFTPERSEVSVKVLDGRAINGRFWVFVGAMTDVELDIEVEDRITGEVWSYHNPLGNFLSFGDIEAFPRNGEPEVAAVAAAPRGGSLLGTDPAVLVDGRFEVSALWTTATGSGVGQGRLLTGDTAAFYFFSPANVELLVNVLDGRPINGKFWVYFGSLSDVEYTVTVKDRVGGTTKTYFNPAGRFASLGDSQAF